MAALACAWTVQTARTPQVSHYVVLKIDEGLGSLGARRILDVAQAEASDLAEFTAWSAALWNLLPSLVKSTRRGSVVGSKYIEVLYHIPLEHRSGSTTYSELAQHLLSSCTF